MLWFVQKIYMIDMSQHLSQKIKKIWKIIILSYFFLRGTSYFFRYHFTSMYTPWHPAQKHSFYWVLYDILWFVQKKHMIDMSQHLSQKIKKIRKIIILSYFFRDALLIFLRNHFTTMYTPWNGARKLFFFWVLYEMLWFVQKKTYDRHVTTFIGKIQKYLKKSSFCRIFLLRGTSYFLKISLNNHVHSIKPCSITIILLSSIWKTLIRSTTTYDRHVTTFIAENQKNLKNHHFVFLFVWEAHPIFLKNHLTSMYTPWNPARKCWFYWILFAMLWFFEEKKHIIDMSQHLSEKIFKKIIILSYFFSEMHFLVFLDISFPACAPHETHIQNVRFNELYTKCFDFFLKKAINRHVTQFISNFKKAEQSSFCCIFLRCTSYCPYKALFKHVYPMKPCLKTLLAISSIWNGLMFSKKHIIDISYKIYLKIIKIWKIIITSYYFLSGISHFS